MDRKMLIVDLVVGIIIILWAVYVYNGAVDYFDYKDNCVTIAKSLCASKNLTYSSARVGLSRDEYPSVFCRGEFDELLEFRFVC